MAEESEQFPVRNVRGACFLTTDNLDMGFS